MRMLDLATNDLRQIARDRKSAFFLLIMPLAFTVLFGLAFGGFTAGDDEDPRLPVGLLDQDGSGLSDQLAGLLAISAVIRVEVVTEAADELANRVGSNTLAAGVVIPAGYGDGLRAGAPQPVTLIADPAGATSFAVQTEVDTAVRRLDAAATTARISADTLRHVAAQWDDTAQRAAFDTALDRAVAAWARPPVSTVSVAGAAPAAADAPRLDNAFAQSSPGMMVQFAIAGLLSAAGVLVAERRSRCLPRLLTTNMSRVEILGGHFLAMFAIIFGQLLLLALFGQLFLGLSYAHAALATLLMIAATALFAASMGLLIGALARSQEQVVVFSLLPMFVLAGLGGAWVPLEFTPAAFQQVARLTPLAWSMAGLQDIIVRGQGLPAVLPAVAVLLAYSLALLILAVWRFRFE